MVKYTYMGNPTKDNLSSMSGIKITPSHEVTVNWKESWFGYTDEDLNTTDANGVSLRVKLDTLTKKLINTTTFEERTAAMNEVGLSNYDDIHAGMAAAFVRQDLGLEPRKVQTPAPPLPRQSVGGGAAPRQEEDGLLHSPTLHSPTLPHSPTLHSPTIQESMRHPKPPYNPG